MPTASLPLTVLGYEAEVDTYSADRGSDRENLAHEGGSSVLRARLGSVAYTVAVSSADLDRALGRALALLLNEVPPAGATSVSITGYIDSETAEFSEVAREHG